MRRADPTLLVLLALVIAGAAIAWLRTGGWGNPPILAGQSLAETMGPTADADAFARVTGPEPLDFPQDHGAHPDYRTEWWYFTGNLTGEDGRDYGAWMGHFAITDIDGGEHRASERYQRGAVGLAGAETEPVRVWMDDWVIESHGPAALFPATLKARAPEKGIAIDLRVDALKPHVLQGDRGYSQKGADPANASRYYSYTRLAADGVIEFDGRRVPARGSAWLDREWSTSALSRAGTGLPCSLPMAGMSWSIDCAGAMGAPTRIPPAFWWMRMAAKNASPPMISSSPPPATGKAPAPARAIRWPGH
jgi:predicted secreted hydrolase